MFSCFFFPFAMSVIPNFQKLFLETQSIKSTISFLALLSRRQNFLHDKKNHRILKRTKRFCFIRRWF